MSDVAERDDIFVGVKPVDERHAFNSARLESWLKHNIEGFEGPLQIEQFKGGQSNPTYKLSTPKKSYVLRRRPPGNLLPSAHAVDREFRVLSALRAAGYGVPRVHALCEDGRVIGSAFYVMDMVEGRIFWDPALPGCTPAERRAIYNAQIATLARLHNFDPERIGLSDYGKPGNYFIRQIERWTRQYRASETEHLEDMERLMAWLPKGVPIQDRVSVIHGDYRINNMVLHPSRPQVTAVLDWELSTLGDPLADLAWFLMIWSMPPDERTGFSGQDTQALGIPSMEEIVSIYCVHTCRDREPTLDWLLAFSFFRLAAICQGIRGRVRDGTAVSPHAQTAGERVRALSRVALDYARKAGA